MRSFFNPVHTVGVAGASSTNKASGAPKSLGDGEGKRKLPEPSSKDDDTSSPEKQARTKGSSARSQAATSSRDTSSPKKARPAAPSAKASKPAPPADDDELETARAELEKVRAHNKKLEFKLSQAGRDKTPRDKDAASSASSSKKRGVKGGYHETAWTKMTPDDIVADLTERGVPRTNWPTKKSQMVQGPGRPTSSWGRTCVEFNLPHLTVAKAAAVVALIQQETQL